MIFFEHTWVLLGLLIIPAYFWWKKRGGHQSEGTMRVSSIALIPEAFRQRGNNRIQIINILKVFTVTLIIIGLARPRIVESIQEKNVEVVDIIMILDISSSMLAEDFNPNRLEAVKRTAKTFIENREGDRIGLLVFAGESFIQCPLTVDKNVLVNLLDEVRIADREVDGTAIGMAIANAINRLRFSEAESKVMILLSDGSNNAGELDPLTAADLASQFDIRIYTIGAGTNQSVSFIPNRGYIRNEIDEKTLKEIARRTGGRYFRATDEDMLADIYNEIGELEKTEIQVKEYTQYRELFGWLLIPALLLGLGYETLDRSVFRRRT
ncbi:MAG TPA: VWA domain-containing protein [Candidatus Marinimicrobia bacterium]|nr:VWA domain-containing protein [Candidatus Neomarinimicrobiota bacterium]